jgi:hypothetical protein
MLLKSLAGIYRMPKTTNRQEDDVGSNKVLRKFGILPQHYTESRPRRPWLERKRTSKLIEREGTPNYQYRPRCVSFNLQNELVSITIVGKSKVVPVL